MRIGLSARKEKETLYNISGSCSKKAASYDDYW